MEIMQQQRTVTHSTFVIERTYNASPERVFQAFTDPVKKRSWFVEGEGFQTLGHEMDFRVGGVETSQFRLGSGPVEGAVITNRTTYQDIVPDRRIVIAYTMSIDDARMSASLATFELVPAAGGTNLVFTEQGAFFENADGPQMREAGWRQLLEALGRELE